MIKFFIERNSSVPFHTQIKEQIKIALALGQLGEGAVLPSIREMESSLGIGRMVVLRAYRELERCGILALKRGRGVTVNHAPDPLSTQRVLREFTRLGVRLEEGLEKQGLNPTSFARFFYRKCLFRDTQEGSVIFVDSSARFAQENADQVSAVWEIHIQGISIEDLKAMDAARLRRILAIATNYYRYEEVREIVRKSSIPVVPMSFDWSQDTLQILRRVPAGSAILVVQSPADFERHADVFRKMLEQSFQAWKIHFEMVAYSSPQQLHALARSKRHSKIMISNRVWEHLPESIRRLNKVFRPRIQLSVDSILEAQFKAGIVV